MPILTFLAGIVSGILAIAYDSRRFALLADLSVNAPAIYLICGSFILWLILAVATISRHGMRRRWWLISAPLALYLPSKFLVLLFGCSFLPNCDL